MKFSESPEYMRYISSVSEEKFDEAEEALRSCLAIARGEGNTSQVAYLLQVLGDVYFRRGDKEGALIHFFEAENVAPDCPIIKYLFAKFLADWITDYEGAISKCDEVIAVASTTPWPKTEEDSSSNHYLALCYALQGYCYCLLKDFHRAGERLLRLLELKDEDVVAYVVELCECLMANGYHAAEAKSYLTYFLVKVKESPQSEDYQPWIKEIEDILARS